MLWILFLQRSGALCSTHQSCAQCIAEFWEAGSCVWYVPHDTHRPARCMAGALRSSPPVPGTRRFEARQGGMEIVLYDHDQLSTNSCYKMDCAKKPTCPYSFVKTEDVPCSASYDPIWRIITCCSRQANEDGFTEGYNVIDNVIDGFVYYMKCCPHCYPGTYLTTIEPQKCLPDMTCNLCPAGTYNREQGLRTMEFCLLCMALTCPFGQYRKQCGGAYEGYCADCEEGFWGENCATPCADCPNARYRIGCGGAHEGTCEICPVGTFWSPPECRDCVACTYIPDSHRVVCMGNNPGVCARCSAGQYEESVGVCSVCAACPAGQLRIGCAAENEGGCVGFASASVNGTTLQWDTIGDVYPFGGPDPTYCIADYGAGCTASDLSVGYWKIDLMRADIKVQPSESVLVANLGLWWPSEVTVLWGTHSVAITIPDSVQFPLTSYFVQVSYVDNEGQSISVRTEHFSVTSPGGDYPYGQAIEGVWGRPVVVDWLQSLQRIYAWDAFSDPWTEHGNNLIASVGVQETTLFNSWHSIDCGEAEVCPMDVVTQVATLWNNTRDVLSSVLAVHLTKLAQTMTDMTELNSVITAMADKMDFSYVHLAQQCTRAAYNGASPVDVLRCAVWLTGAAYSKTLKPTMSWIEPAAEQVQLTTEWKKFTSAVLETLENPALNEILHMVQDIGELIIDTGGGTRDLHVRSSLPAFEILEDMFSNMDPRNGSVWGFGRETPIAGEDEKIGHAGVEMQQLMITRLRLFRDIIRLSGATSVLKDVVERLVPLPADLSLYTDAFLTRGDSWLKDRANEIKNRIVSIGAASSELSMAYAWHRIKTFRRNAVPNLGINPPDLATVANAFHDERAQASIDFDDYTGKNDITSERYRGFVIYDILARTHPMALSIAPNLTAFTVLPLPVEAKLLRKLLDVRRFNAYAFLRGQPRMRVEEEGSCIPESMANGLTAEQLAANGMRLCGNNDFVDVELRPLGSASRMDTKHEGTRCLVNSPRETHEGNLYGTWLISIPNVDELDLDDGNDLRIVFEIDFKANGGLTQHAFLGQKGDVLHPALPSRCRDDPTGDYHVWPGSIVDDGTIEVGNETITVTNVTMDDDLPSATFGPGIIDEEEDEETEIPLPEMNFTFEYGAITFAPEDVDDDTVVVENTEWREWLIAAGIFVGGGLVVPGLYFLCRALGRRAKKRIPGSVTKRFALWGDAIAPKVAPITRRLNAWQSAWKRQRKYIAPEKLENEKDESGGNEDGGLMLSKPKLALLKRTSEDLSDVSPLRSPGQSCVVNLNLAANSPPRTWQQAGLALDNTRSASESSSSLCSTLSGSSSATNTLALAHLEQGSQGRRSKSSSSSSSGSSSSECPDTPMAMFVCPNTPDASPRGEQLLGKPPSRPPDSKGKQNSKEKPQEPSERLVILTPDSVFSPSDSRAPSITVVPPDAVESPLKSGKPPSIIEVFSDAGSPTRGKPPSIIEVSEAGSPIRGKPPSIVEVFSDYAGSPTRGSQPTNTLTPNATNSPPITPSETPPSTMHSPASNSSDEVLDDV